MTYEPTVSPSQIKEGLECIRLVGWQIVDPIPFERRPEQDLGDEVHDKLEWYNRAGTNPYDGSVKPDGKPAGDETLASLLAMKALPYGPKPKHGQSEGQFKWAWKGVTISGRDDWHGKTTDLANAPPVEEMPCEVDYKTTKDPSYGIWVVMDETGQKDESAFYNDAQSLIYAKRRMELTGADKVYNRWLYIRTGEKRGKPAAAMPSDCVMTKARVDEAFERVVYPVAAAIVTMKKIGKRLNVLALPPNPSRCRKYVKGDGSGACPRIAQCQVSDIEALAHISGEGNSMNPLQAILEKEQAQLGQAPTFNPAPPTQAAATAGFNPFGAPPAQAAIAAPASLPQTPAAKVEIASAFSPANTAAAAALLEKSAFNPPAPAPAALQTAIDTVDRAIAGERPTDAQIGAVVRFLFGK